MDWNRLFNFPPKILLSHLHIYSIHIEKREWKHYFLTPLHQKIGVLNKKCVNTSTRTYFIYPMKTIKD